MSEITAITPQAKDKTRCNVFVDGRFYCGLTLETAMKLRLKAGQTVSEELLSKAMSLAKVWGDKLVKALNADGLNLVQNNGLAAGQTVFHYHLHLIPRYEGDNVGNLWNPGTLTEEQKKEILEKLA